MASLLQAVTHTRKSRIAPLRPDAVFEDEMAAFDLDANTVTKEGHYAVSRFLSNDGGTASELIGYRVSFGAF